ncbi:hypothetical protein PoB_005870100 [Plakobranchus ocellatus]|uniref:Apple domain-containing protein n=1 Tax=Plakobranchus ocellatus TaxID=259542 RepID=A0AAV4CH87_9GAST|nr:hypothetical protein PoB_005870100 [Plakobranchus ocellatus]
MFCSKRRSQFFPILLWLLYQVIFRCSSYSCPSKLFTFVKQTDHELLCEFDFAPLMPSPGNHLVCAETCWRHSECTAFIFTAYNASFQGTVTGSGLGICSWCPPNNIAGISLFSSDPQVEIWFNVLGKLKSPPSKKYLPIPGALSIGRYLVVRGRVPKPPPDRVVVDRGGHYP